MSDIRDFAHLGIHNYIKDVRQHNDTLMLEDDEGNQAWFRFRYEACSVCKGHGTHVNPNIDRQGITGDEMARMGDQFRHDYLNGLYDQPCNRCDGEKVMPDLVLDHLDEVQQEVIDNIMRIEDELLRCDQIAEMERRFGC